MFDPHPLVEVRVLDPRLRDWGLPDYQSDMAAAIDLHACLDNPLHLSPGSAPVLIPSGIAVYLGSPYVAAMLIPRSGLGHKTGLVLGNLVGLIDGDYTGGVMISAWNRNPAGGVPIVVRPGDRVAQMMFVPVLRPRFQVVEQFSTVTQRGDNGFGSTGTGRQER